MKTKKFHIGDVLSVTSECLASPRGLDGFYDILKFMTGGDRLFTMQIPRVELECMPHLLAQFPQLAEVDVSCVNEGNHAQWLAEQVAEYGEELEVRRLPEGAHQFRDPVEEMEEMMGRPEKVIVCLN